MTSVKPGVGKGVLDPKRGAGKFRPQRFHPPAELADTVEHFWEVEWSLPEGEIFVQHTIPFPAVHVVFERGRTEVVGPITGRFTRELLGSGRVVGAHIKPGMFSAFTDVPLFELVDRRPQTADVLPISAEDARELERDILAHEGVDSAELFASALKGWLADEVPAECGKARDLVAMVEGNKDLTKTEELAKRAGTSVRSLQRLFRNYVGVTPKAVIQRFRLLEASERLIAEPSSGAQVATELGFSDQAHFIRAFKNLVGETPDRYAKRNA